MIGGSTSLFNNRLLKMRVHKIFKNFILRLTFTSKQTLIVYGFVLGFVTMVIVQPHLAANRNTGSREGRELQEDTIERLLREEKRGDGGDDRLARAVSNRTRILCWVMIRDSGNIKARALRATWGKRCDKLLFFGVDDEFSAIDLRTQEGKRYLAAKTFTSLKYIHKYHIDDAEWFLKADDDTYIVMENLKYFLSEENPESAVYFGEFFNPFDTKYLRYNSGGAGYVLSKEALRRYGELSLLRSVCADPMGPEDKEIGYCLRHLGVEIGETTDRMGNSRFHYDRADLHAVGDAKQWYRDFMGDRYRQGTDTMSVYPISFHYLQHYDIHMLEFLFYRLRPHGVLKPFQELYGGCLQIIEPGPDNQVINIMSIDVRNWDTMICVNQVSEPDHAIPLVAFYDKHGLLKISSYPDLEEKLALKVPLLAGHQRVRANLVAPDHGIPAHHTSYSV